MDVICPECGKKGWLKTNGLSVGVMHLAQIFSDLEKEKAHGIIGKQTVEHLLGKRCVRCGYSNAESLQLHHIRKKETIVLCANCHVALHKEIRKLYEKATEEFLKEGTFCRTISTGQYGKD